MTVSLTFNCSKFDFAQLLDTKGTLPKCTWFKSLYILKIEMIKSSHFPTDPQSPAVPSSSEQNWWNFGLWCPNEENARRLWPTEPHTQIGTEPLTARQAELQSVFMWIKRLKWPWVLAVVDGSRWESIRLFNYHKQTLLTGYRSVYQKSVSVFCSQKHQLVRK